MVHKALHNKKPGGKKTVGNLRNLIMIMTIVGNLRNLIMIMTIVGNLFMIMMVVRSRVAQVVQSCKPGFEDFSNF